ncbi:hypothetical protein GGR03_003048 [Aurantimonas endophytica]|uniref:DUF465 domain-containing protein n=1 Tax=Aurantimonas endophytica TaxID=1522175 RepID=A0A7W6MQE1_9HYPH|nr:hypothetical protein [Aurantimonas endophytica]
MDTHLATLEQRHSALDNEISAALVSKPAMTDAELAEMKRRKLKLKDEIERLRQPRN